MHDETPKKIKTRTSEYELRPDGIIVQTSQTTELHTLADALENGEAFRRLAAGSTPRLLVDLRVTGATENGVREYYAELSKEASAVAFVIGTVVGRVIGNFYMAMKRPPTPTQLFTDVGEALRWLDAQRGPAKR